MQTFARKIIGFIGIFDDNVILAEMEETNVEIAHKKLKLKVKCSMPTLTYSEDFPIKILKYLKHFSRICLSGL